MFEREYLRWLREQAAASPHVQLGIGDDAAVLEPHADHTVMTTDLLVDQVHFSVDTTDLALIGRKAIAVSLSDIAAMGAVPLAAVINLCLPKTFSLSDARRLHQGAAQVATEHQCPIVGGDTNRWDQGLVIGSTIIGRVAGRAWRIDGAQVGDRLLVTGPLGGSILGKHLNFEPRCRLAIQMASRFSIHGATDISDSLTIDANEMATRSQTGIELIAKDIPVSDAARRLASIGSARPRTPLEHALYDGEDFELLMAVDPGEAKRILADPEMENCVYDIGRFVARPGMWLDEGNESLRELTPRGFEH